MRIFMHSLSFDAVHLYAQRPRENSSDASSAVEVLEPILASVREKTLRRLHPMFAVEYLVTV